MPVCQNCAQPLPPGSGPRRRYCSAACRVAAHRSARHGPRWKWPYILTCAVCTVDFLAQRPEAIYCSPTCRAHAGHQRAGRRLDAPTPQPNAWRTGPNRDRVLAALATGEFWDRRRTD